MVGLRRSRAVSSTSIRSCASSLVYALTSTGPAHHPQQDLNTPPAVTKLDVQETAKTAIKRDNCGQARFADQRRVSGHTGRKWNRNVSFSPGKP